jgi:hypothetical protein
MTYKIHIFAYMKKGETLPRIKRICKCGKEFEVRPKRIEQGRGLYCSQECKYKYRTRPTGLVYKIVKENPTSFKKGIKPWNTGRRDLPRPVNFKYENVGYDALHDWVKRHREKAICCEHCGRVGYLEWANKSHEYKRELSDWMALCKPCHIKYDRESNTWGLATKKFNLPKRTKK